MQYLKSGFNKIELFIIAIIILGIYFMGAVMDIMEVDAAQYASISRQMLETHQFLKIWNGMSEYLDKPPFLFWISALSIKLFGVSSWAYKLPSILLSLLGIYSTYSLARLLYNEKTGIVSAILLASCQAFFLMNHDVRTDNILSTAIIFSLWQLFAFLKNSKSINLILGFVGIGVAMLTKGPIGMMVPVFALSSHFVYKKQWQLFFKWEWLIGLLFVSVMLIPMCIGLYEQYGNRGLYFYFWEQSFGRITGENKWRNDTSVFYFTHVLLWSLLPWCLLFIFAFISRTKQLFKFFNSGSYYEALSWGGFILTFIAFSLSKYKLPHYIFIAFPLAAILCSSWLTDLEEKNRIHVLKMLVGLQMGFSVLLYLASTFLMYVFPPDHIWLWFILMLLFFSCSIISFRSDQILKKVIFPGLYTILFINIIMNGNFYPKLFKYQATSVAGKLFHEKQQAGEKLYFLNIKGHDLDFYGKIITEELPDSIQNTAWLYTNEPGLEHLKEKGVTEIERIEFKKYPVQLLSYRFLNPKTRENTLENNYLVHIKGGKM